MNINKYLFEGADTLDLNNNDFHFPINAKSLFLIEKWFHQFIFQVLPQSKDKKKMIKLGPNYAIFSILKILDFSSTTDMLITIVCHIKIF